MAADFEDDSLLGSAAFVFQTPIRAKKARIRTSHGGMGLSGAQIRRITRRRPEVMVKVTGSAPDCRRKIEGSGFVFAPQHVMTNAHVVAGTRGPVTVELNGSRKSGKVVYFDPERDLAVVDVPGLTANALSWSTSQAESGADAVVVGFPLNGPFKAVSARIRDVTNVPARDIYDKNTVTREVYAIRSTVQSGNSGGPLLNPDGTLLGVIFAAALDDPETGFALTDSVARPVTTATATATTEVDTGPCT